MKKEKSFEEAMIRLEEIVEHLESGKIGLEESLAAFEEGIDLVRYCNDKLTQAEQRVRILSEKENGERAAEPFVPQEKENA